MRNANSVGIYFKSMAGPTTLFPLAHFWFSPSRSGGPSLVFFQKRFVCFVNGLMSNAIALLPLSLEGKGYSFLKSPGSWKDLSFHRNFWWFFTDAKDGSFFAAAFLWDCTVQSQVLLSHRRPTSVRLCGQKGMRTVEVTECGEAKVCWRGVGG